MNVSLCITTYNRFDLTIKSCAQVLNDPRIDDIVILDDKSTDGSFEKLVEYYKPYPHVRVIQQVVNRRMQQNKADAIAYAKNEWVIIFDSDNVIDKTYIDALPHLPSLLPSFIYCPSFARPSFDYRKFASSNFNLKRHWEYINDKTFVMLLNTCNYVVNRDRYLSVYEYNPAMKASDTIWFAYLWLKSGGTFFVVSGMQYDHLVHSGSGFMEDADYNMKQGENIRKMIMAL